MQLAFSTLGCPQWTFSEILATASRLGYDGIEIRGLLNEINVEAMPEFQPASIAETHRMVQDAGLKITCLSSSVTIFAAMQTAHDQQTALNTAKCYLDMAQQVQAPFIRLFCGDPAADIPYRTAEEQAALWLRELGDYAATRQVTVLLETHDACCDSVKLASLIQITNHPSVQVLWDIHHPYRFVGETVEETMRNIGKYTRYTHVKDSLLAANGETQYVLTGDGDIPLIQAINALSAAGYDGFLTLEWEKRWHPTLAEPEVVFPQYIQQMRQWLHEENN